MKECSLQGKQTSNSCFRKVTKISLQLCTHYSHKTKLGTLIQKTSQILSTSMAAPGLRKTYTNRVFHGRNLPRCVTYSGSRAPRVRSASARTGTRGIAFLVFEDIYDVDSAVEHLLCVNVSNRYPIVFYYSRRRWARYLTRGRRVIWEKKNTDNLLPAESHLEALSIGGPVWICPWA
ncbi:pre-mRNA branch site p14-like protein [Striga asiatica]|uniref:Pre-mRNA branch site p14-like protein n=1 Tax=Striga asiatica TaxID=4170 RepID=A0A5A7PQ95_STRAF|nr:pre-mRNA branch site p14-like protein [Striga asiatica]